MEYLQTLRNFNMFSFEIGAVVGFLASLFVWFVLSWITRHAKTVIIISAVISAVSLLLLAV